MDGTEDRGNEWGTVSKITKPFNTHPFSLRLGTKPTLEYMIRHLVGFYSAKDINKVIAYIGITHYTKKKYGSFLSYHHYSSEYYVTL